jgi:hypothetical protein
VLFEVSLPSRIQVDTSLADALPAWTERISRDGAVVRARWAEWAQGGIQKSDRIVLEVELPKLHPFQPRCIYCQGRVDSVMRLPGELVRVAISIGRMELRTTRFSAAREPASCSNARGKRALRSVS